MITGVRILLQLTYLYEKLLAKNIHKHENLFNGGVILIGGFFVICSSAKKTVLFSYT